MKTSKRSNRRFTHLPRFRFDTLESRRLLSIAYLEVTGVTPADSSVVASSPTTIVVQFNDSINPSSLSTSMNPIQYETDIQILQNGNPLIGPSLFAGEQIDPSNPNAVDITLPAGALTPGTYQIQLAPFALPGLSGMTDGEPLDPNIVGTTIGSFTIVNPGPTLASATNLGVIGTSTVSATGSLNLQTNPQDYQLFQITLQPSSTPWLLGTQVLTSTIGSNLNPELALFNNNGQLIQQTSIGTPTARTEPFLFNGLAPGTYYIGISGIGNNPINTNGYNPVTGFPGNGTLAQSGGSFELQLLAQPVVKPTTVIGFQLNQADQLSTNPTGFSIQFSSALFVNPPKGDLGDFLAGAIEVVGQNGTVLPVTAVGFNQSTSLIRYIFNNPLPAGSYSIRLPSKGGLVNLAGDPPIAPGLPAGDLANFQVAPAQPLNDPYNLGPIYPALPASNIVTNLDSANNQSQIYRFVVTDPGIYQLSYQSSGSAIGVLTSTNGSPIQTITLKTSASLRSIVLNLQPGEWFLHIVSSQANPTSSPAMMASPTPSSVTIDWSLGLNQSDPESTLISGIGQGPALGLMVIDPTAVLGAPSSNGPLTAPNPQPMTTLGINSAVSPTGSSSIDSPNFASGTGALILSFGGNAVGRPTIEGDQILTAASVGSGNSVALAALGEGIGFGQSASNNTRNVIKNYLDQDSIVETDAVDETTIVSDASPETPLTIAVIEPETPNRNGGGVLERLGSLFDPFSISGESLAEITGDAPTDASANAAKSNRGEVFNDFEESDKLQHASFQAPIGAGLLALALYRSRSTIARWARGRRRNLVGRAISTAPTNPRRPAGRPNFRHGRAQNQG